jgi:GTP-binding protein YchF
MKVVLIGLPRSGKKTLFELLTRRALSPSELSFRKPVAGIVEIRDPRFDRLAAIYRPKKLSRARIDIELLPEIGRRALREGAVFKDIAGADAVCHVVRAFEDEAVYRADGPVDPLGDIDAVNTELLLHDLLFAEKRLDRIEHSLKKRPDDAGLRERALVAKIKRHLEGDRPLRTLPLTAEEERAVSGYPFITRMRMIVALNVSESALGDRALLDRVEECHRPLGIRAMAVCAEAESEIARLESEGEKAAFLDALGIAEPAVDALARLCLSALGLVSFFTAESRELRQWLLRSGSTAPAAAGVIHSDMERGFIRAEVMKYADLDALGGEAEVRGAGKALLKGREYVVEDGDILAIRFSV